MERRVATGRFTQLAVRDREVFVVPRGESAIVRIAAENGARDEIVRNANHDIADLFATRTNLVWSRAPHLARVTTDVETLTGEPAQTFREAAPILLR